MSDLSRTANPSVPPDAVLVAQALACSPAELALALTDQAARGRQPLAVKDIESGRYLWVSAAMAALAGREPSALIGRTDAELFPAAASALRSAEQAALALSAGTIAEHRLETVTDGRPPTRREFSVYRLVLGRESGAPRRLLSIWTEVTEPRQRDAQYKLALQQIESLQHSGEQVRREQQDRTFLDSATGLYSGAYFQDQLRRELDLSSREHREFALVSVRLDPPAATAPAIDDEGRARVLEALGRLLRDNTRAMDASCRVDGDRFAVLLSGVGLATAHARMEGVRRQCAEQIIVQGGVEFGFSVSMGVASYPHTSDAPQGLLDAAETALADAMQRGGNRVTLATIRFTPAVG